MSLSYAGVRSHNGYTWIFGNRNPDGSCCQPLSPDFGNVLLSDATKSAWYDALLLQVNKQYSASSKWAATLAYTYGHATANGGDFFTLDFIDVADSPRHRAQQDQRHTIVVSGIVGLPWDMMATTLLQLGTGTGFTIQDATNGFGFGEQRIALYGGFIDETLGETFPFVQWDLALRKDFPVGDRDARSPGLRLQRHEPQQLRLLRRVHPARGGSAEPELRHAGLPDHAAAAIPVRGGRAVLTLAAC